MSMMDLKIEGSDRPPIVSRDDPCEKADVSTQEWPEVLRPMSSTSSTDEDLCREIVWTAESPSHTSDTSKNPDSVLDATFAPDS